MKLSSAIKDGRHIDSLPPALVIEDDPRWLWGVAGLMVAFALIAWASGARIADRPELIDSPKGKEAGGDRRSTKASTGSALVPLRAGPGFLSFLVSLEPRPYNAVSAVKATGSRGKPQGERNSENLDHSRICGPLERSGGRNKAIEVAE